MSATAGQTAGPKGLTFIDGIYNFFFQKSNFFFNFDFFLIPRARPVT